MSVRELYTKVFHSTNEFQSNRFSLEFQGARVWLPDPERVWRAVLVATNYDGKGKLEVTSNDGKKVISLSPFSFSRFERRNSFD